MDKKTLSNQEKKIAIKAELVTGSSPRMLAEEYDVHYTTVLGYRRDIREGGSAAEVLDVAKEDAHILKIVAEEVKAKVVEAKVVPPMQAKEFGAKVDSIVEGVSSLQLLDTAFHNTITKLLTFADSLITPDMTIAEWKAISSQVGELYKAVFASGGVQVNVQQNNVGGAFAQGMVN